MRGFPNETEGPGVKPVRFQDDVTDYRNILGVPLATGEDRGGIFSRRWMIRAVKRDGTPDVHVISVMHDGVRGSRLKATPSTGEAHLKG